MIIFPFLSNDVNCLFSQCKWNSVSVYRRWVQSSDREPGRRFPHYSSNLPGKLRITSHSHIIYYPFHLMGEFHILPEIQNSVWLISLTPFIDVTIFLLIEKHFKTFFKNYRNTRLLHGDNLSTLNFLFIDYGLYIGISTCHLCCWLSWLFGEAVFFRIG